MANVIYQPVAGRLRIDNRDFSLEDLVMDYMLSSDGSTYLIRIRSKVTDTGIASVELSDIEDNVGGTYANIAAWLAWWEALDFGMPITATISGVSTEAKQDTLIAKDFATQTTLAAVLAKIVVAPATEAKQDDSIANQTDGTQKTQVVDGSGNVIGSTSNALDVNEVNLKLAASSNSIGISEAKVSLQSFFEAVAGWVEDTAGTDGLAISVEHRGPGTKSIEFDKIAGDADARISRTVTSFDMSEYTGRSTGHMMIYLSSLTDVSKVYVRMGTDSTNYFQWDFETANLKVGWNFLDAVITFPTSQTGNGADFSAITFMALGVEFTGAAITLADIRTCNWFITRTTSTVLQANILSETSSPFLSIKDGNGNTKLDVASGTYNYLYSRQTDGTNLAPTMDASARAGHQKIYSNTVKDGSGTAYVPLVDNDGHFQVDVLTDPSAIYRTFSKTVTRPANTTAYTAADVIGDVAGTLDTIADVAKATGYGVCVTNIRIQTTDTGLSGKTIRVHILNDADSAIADNSAFAIGDSAKRRGYIDVVMGTGNLALEGQTQLENLVVNPVARAVYFILETTEGFTPSGNSTTLKVEIGCILSN